MTTLHDHVSPDGLLRFQVLCQDDGDMVLGFHGFPWHTHADMLAAVLHVPEREAVERMVQELLGSRAVIAVSRVGGEMRDVWVTDDPASESRYEDESVEIRYWDGTEWSEP